MEPVKSNFFSKLKFFILVNKFWAIMIAFFSISSIGMTGYLLTASKEPSLPGKPVLEKIIPTLSPIPSLQEISITPISPTATPSPTIALINPTATWSAFTSSKYSYSIKYPPNWTAKITDQTDPKILEYVVFNPVATKAGTLSITLSYGTRTYAQALTLDPQPGNIIKVASVSATQKTSKDSNGYKATNVIVPFGSNTIIFNAKNVFINLFNQMLTTLKLTK